MVIGLEIDSYWSLSDSYFSRFAENEVFVNSTI